MKSPLPDSHGTHDRLIQRNGKFAFIDFKATGKKPSKLQEQWLKEHWANNVPAFICDDIEQAQRIITLCLL